MKKLKGWRTRLVTVVGLIVAVLQFVDPVLLGNALGPDWQKWIIFVYPIVYGVLREFTTTAPGRAE